MSELYRLSRRALIVGGASTLALSCVRRSGTPAADAAPKPITYVAIGASDTVGVGAGAPETESWPAVLWRKLPAGSRLVNLGISGSLLKQALDQRGAGGSGAGAARVHGWP